VANKVSADTESGKIKRRTNNIKYGLMYLTGEFLHAVPYNIKTLCLGGKKLGGCM